MYSLQDLKEAANAVGHPEWGNGGPNNAGTINKTLMFSVFSIKSQNYMSVLLFLLKIVKIEAHVISSIKTCFYNCCYCLIQSSAKILRSADQKNEAKTCSYCPTRP